MFNKNCTQTVQLEKPVKQPVALCFDDKGRLYVSTFQGSVFLIELQLDLVNIRGTVLASIQLDCKLLYGVVFLSSSVYISALDNNGGIYKVDFNKEKVEKIAANGGPLCKRAHSLANYCNHSIVFTDVDDFVSKCSTQLQKKYLC